MDVRAHLISPDWRKALGTVLSDTATAPLMAFLDDETKARRTWLPDPQLVFAAYNLVPPGRARVVIVGQDPYPTPGHAHGLAFSYRGSGSVPRSLRNILEEVARDMACDMDAHSGDLTAWAKQGVFLLNTILTVREGDAGAHRGKGWEAITAATIDVLASQPQRVVFLLWGNHAKRMSRVIANRQPVLTASHPSPLSVRGFRGCGHFSEANTLLGEYAIDWQRTL